jgi:hypothetical protein
MSFSQDNLSVVYTNIIKDDLINVHCKVYVAKQLQDTTFVFKSKEFRNQTMISLSEGEYRFYYCYLDTIVFVEHVTITATPAVMVFNLLIPNIPLIDFDLGKVIFATNGMFDLTMRKDSYMEF